MSLCDHKRNLPVAGNENSADEKTNSDPHRFGVIPFLQLLFVPVDSIGAQLRRCVESRHVRLVFGRYGTRHEPLLAALSYLALPRYAKKKRSSRAATTDHTGDLNQWCGGATFLFG